MKLSFRKILTGLAMAAAAALPSLALAENGFTQIGIGVKSKGMGGVGIALPQDSLASGMNPAGMIIVGNRWDVGCQYVTQDAKVDDTQDSEGGNSPFHNQYKSHAGMVYPEAGVNWVYTRDQSIGFAVYVPGMMITDYDKALGSLGTSSAEFKFETLYFTPSWSWQINGVHSIGIALNVCAARLKVEGLEFIASTIDSSNATNRGWNYEEGVSIRFGWIAQLSPEWRIGATVQSKTWMGKFKHYKGLLPTNGDFDLPSQIGVGAAWQAMPELVFCGEIVRVNYRGIEVFDQTNDERPFGSTNGAGFGWTGQTIYKFGVAWDVWKKLTLRAGYNYATNPIRSGETWLNQLTQAVIAQHVTIGGSWAWDRNEISIVYLNGIRRDIGGRNSLTLGREIDLRNVQNTVGLSFGRTF